MTVVLNVSNNMADIDWIRTARLMKRAEEGDVAAYRELLRLEETPMVPLGTEDEEND